MNQIARCRDVLFAREFTNPIAKEAAEKVHLSEAVRFLTCGENMSRFNQRAHGVIFEKVAALVVAAE